MVKGLDIFQEHFAADLRISVPKGIAADLDRFLQRLMADGTYSAASLGLSNPLDEIVRRISQAHETGDHARRE